MNKTASFRNQMKLPLEKVKYEDGWRELAIEYWEAPYKLVSENGNTMVFKAEHDYGDYSSFPDPFEEIWRFEEYLQDMRMDCQGASEQDRNFLFFKYRVAPLLIVACIGLFWLF